MSISYQYSLEALLEAFINRNSVDENKLYSIIDCLKHFYDSKNGFIQALMYLPKLIISLVHKINSLNYYWDTGITLSLVFLPQFIILLAIGIIRQIIYRMSLGDLTTDTGKSLVVFLSIFSICIIFVTYTILMFKFIMFVYAEVNGKRKLLLSKLDELISRIGSIKSIDSLTENKLIYILSINRRLSRVTQIKVERNLEKLKTRKDELISISSLLSYLFLLGVIVIVVPSTNSNTSSQIRDINNALVWGVTPATTLVSEIWKIYMTLSFGKLIRTKTHVLEILKIAQDFR